MTFRPLQKITTIAAAGTVLATLSGCGMLTGEDKKNASDEGGCEVVEPSGERSDEVVLLTHESFHLPKKLVAQFEAETGYQLTHSPSGDGGELTSQLILNSGNPVGDVAFGVDNTFAAPALEECVFTPYEPDLPAGAEQHELPGDDTDMLTPIDHASVCVNVDDAWFTKKGLEPPTTFEDLTQPDYKGLLVTPGATTSTTGMAFLLATIGHFGDDWSTYWEDLMANDAKVVAGWEDAYNVDFTYSGGDRPIVVSYDTSPAYTVNKLGQSTTSALLDTCFRQVEYAGVLSGAENPEGARAVVDWLLSPEVQAALPTSMYVFPVDAGATLPEEWALHAQTPTAPVEVDPQEIADNREAWLTEWTEITRG